MGFCGLHPAPQCGPDGSGPHLFHDCRDDGRRVRLLSLRTFPSFWHSIFPLSACPAMYLAAQGSVMQIGMSLLIVIYFLATLSIVRRSNQLVTNALENEVAAEQKRKQLEEQKRIVDKEVVARNRSESRLVAMLAQSRSFNVTLERIFKAYITHDRSSEAFIKMAMEELSNSLSVERVSVWLFTPERDAIVCEDLFEASTGQHSNGERLFSSRLPGLFRSHKVQHGHRCKRRAHGSKNGSVHRCLS